VGGERKGRGLKRREVSFFSFSFFFRFFRSSSSPLPLSLPLLSSSSLSLSLTSASRRRRPQCRHPQRRQARPLLRPHANPVEVEPRRPQRQRLLERQQRLSLGTGVARPQQRRRQRVCLPSPRVRQRSTVGVCGKGPALFVDRRSALPAEAQGAGPAHGQRAGVFDAA